MMKMTIDEAVTRLREIALGDKETEALETLEFACKAYRSMAESLEKKLALYRDIAAMPDICYNANAEEGVKKEKYKIDGEGNGADCHAKY